MKGNAKKSKYYCPIEAEEQAALFRWAELQQTKYPALRWMYHIPNGGSRNKAEAARLKAEGVKAGVSDIFLPAPAGPYHGLYIELKKLNGGRASMAQREFIEAMRKLGYCAEIRHGWCAAAELILKYLEGKI